MPHLAAPAIEVRISAATALTNLASGSQACSRAIVAAGGIPTLERRLTAKGQELERVRWALEAIAVAGGSDAAAAVLAQFDAAMSRQQQR